MIIDSHVHIVPEMRGRIGSGPVVGLGFGRVSMGGQEIQLTPPFGEQTCFPTEMLLAHMDWAGVDRAVLLQGPFYGECNEEVVTAVRRYPDRFLGAAYVDPWGQSRDTILALLDRPEFCAAKMECSVATGLCGLHPEADLSDSKLTWLWDTLVTHGKTLVLDLGEAGTCSYQTRAVADIARTRPDLRIVIAHLGQPRPGVIDDPELRSLWDEQIDLGALPNVWLDCAALPAYCVDEEFPFPTVAGLLKDVMNRIGPEKVLWGTDGPGLLTSASYPQLLSMARIHSAHLSPVDQERFLSGNALEAFRGQTS